MAAEVLRKNGIYDQVTNALNGFEVTEFSGNRSNPHYETCMKAVDVVKEKNIDFLVGCRRRFGDRRYEVHRGVCRFRRRSVGYSFERWRDKECPAFGSVLTLSATGSEMNERSVISRAETREKLNFASPLVFPQFAILDPEVTYSLPARQVANGCCRLFYSCSGAVSYLSG